MQAFARAATAWPGHAPALEAWLRTALLTRSWLELAEVACRAPGHRGMVLALLREQLASETDPATLGELERSLAMAG